MGREVYEYADFSGGDWGRIDAWRAPKNTFKGENVLVTRTGELCVRPGVRLAAVTGLANGSVWGIGRLPLNPGSIWFGQGNAIRYFNPSSDSVAVTTATNTLTSSNPGTVAVFENGTTTYLATANANGYSFNGTTITSLNNMPNSDAIALYGDRLAVVPSSSPNTVRFSAAASFNNWTVSAGNAVSITVGDTDPITALVPQRTHLAVLKRSSHLYVISGTPGTNESLRPVAYFDGPTTARGAGLTRADDRIWYAQHNSQYLAAFDGSDVKMFDNIPVSLYTAVAPRTVVPFRDDDQAGVAFVVPSASGAPNEVWLRYRGVWTRHTFGVTLSNFATACFHGYPQEGGSDASLIRYGTKLVFTDGGGASATPNFWTWMPFMDRPGLEADPLSASAERTGDASTTPVTATVELPVQRTKDGTEVVVRGVIVDFRSWQTGASENNGFDLTVDTLNSYESPAPVSSGTASFDESPTFSSLAGSVRSKYFSFGDQGRGSAFQLRLSNVKGVAFQRFRIVAESFPARV